MDEASLLWFAYASGVYGKLGDSVRQYQLYVQLHALRENHISANSGKKRYKPKKPAPFSEFDEGLAKFVGYKEPTMKQKILHMFGEKDASNISNKGLQGSREKSAKSG